MAGRRLLSFLVALGLAGAAGAEERIVEAKYAQPVEWYGHFDLGRPHEYATLAATTDTGRKLELQLPEGEVFEDLAPRLVRLAAGEPDELLAIISRRDSGARLVLIGLSAGNLAITAQAPAIGIPMRWLNPVGVADLDGDGRSEIAAVITPHIGGILTVYRKRGRNLVKVASLPGFSNHVYGSAELKLSRPVRIDGRMRLLVPDATRRRLRVVSLEHEQLVETGSCPLSAPAVSAIDLAECRK